MSRHGARSGTAVGERHGCAWSVYFVGGIKLWLALIRHEPLPQGRFVPEPWPRAFEPEEATSIEVAEVLPKVA